MAEQISDLAVAQATLPSGPSKAALMQAIYILLEFIGDRPLDERLEAVLNEQYGPATEKYKLLASLLGKGIDERWACHEQIAGPQYRRGRIAHSSAATRGFSVESGMLRNVRGNYHRHPKGEITLIVPVDPGAKFCGSGAGWKVCAPNTSHYPTATDGVITALFMLPNGDIEYRDPAA